MKVTAVTGKKDLEQVSKLWIEQANRLRPEIQDKKVSGKLFLAAHYVDTLSTIFRGSGVIAWKESEPIGFCTWYIYEFTGSNSAVIEAMSKSPQEIIHPTVFDLGNTFLCYAISDILRRKPNIENIWIELGRAGLSKYYSSKGFKITREESRSHGKTIQGTMDNESAREFLKRFCK